MRNIEKLNSNDLKVISGGGKSSIVRLCICNDYNIRKRTTPNDCAKTCCIKRSDSFMFDTLPFDCKSYVEMKTRTQDNMPPSEENPHPSPSILTTRSS